MDRHTAYVYLASWLTLCLAAAALVVRKPAEYALLRRDYLRFLAPPWKLATFVLAAGFFVFVAPYTGDPTWDWIDALFISVLAFWSAPWSVGVLYRAVRRQAPWRQAYVAVCVWLFSASWSYDAYIFVRDGFYPSTWSSNLAASSVLYCAAGLLWNLAYVPERGVVFAFMLPHWPTPLAHAQARRVAVYAFVFVFLVVAMMLPFVWPHLSW